MRLECVLGLCRFALRLKSAGIPLLWATSLILSGCLVDSPSTQISGNTFKHTEAFMGECVSCHADAVPAESELVPSTASANLFQHTISFMAAKDCASCHTSVAANVGVSWAGGSYDHKLATGLGVSTCSPCHDAERPMEPVGNPPFYHSVGGLGDCADCHRNAGLSWIGGSGYSHDPIPTACGQCHSGQLPTPATVLPAGGTRNLFAHRVEFNGLEDCVSCHTEISANVGVRWAGGTYDHRLNTGAIVTGTCYPCHQAERPVGLVPAGSSHPFNHAVAGTGDCAECHTVVAANIGVTWAGAFFDHTPRPAACATCHNGLRPNAATLLPAGATTNLYQHSLGFNGQSDCTSCHNNPGVAWVGGTYNHLTNTGVAVSTCYPCHQNERPSGSVGSPPFNHATQGGTGDCASCHTNPGVTWAGGAGYSHNPIPATCNTCHSGARPSPTALLPTGASANLYLHSTTYNGTADCASCHTSVAANVGVRWAGGIWNHRLNTNVLVTSTCYPCHQNERPVGAVGNPPFNHANGGTGDCASCHTSVSANIGVRWSGGQFSHSPTPSACIACHAGDVPPGTVPSTVRGFTHAANYGTECRACHTVVAANIGVRWSNGFFGHNNNNAASFATCSPCHDTREHRAGTNCARSGCHVNTIRWPNSANPPGNNNTFGGSFGSP